MKVAYPMTKHRALFGLMVACLASALTISACGDDDDDNPGTQGTSGKSGSSGSAGKGGSGGTSGTAGTSGASGNGGSAGTGSYATCAEAFDACANDDICNKIFTCITKCVQEGQKATEILDDCIKASGSTSGLPAPGNKLLGCNLGPCKSGSAGSAGASGSAGSAGAAGQGGGGAGGASGGAGGAGGGASTCPDVSEALVKACDAGGSEQNSTYKCFCENLAPPTIITEL